MIPRWAVSWCVGDWGSKIWTVGKNSGELVSNEERMCGVR